MKVPGPEGGLVEHSVDEGVRPGTTVEQLAGLRPAFEHPSYAERFPQIGWHMTAGNSSSLADGASAALVMSAERADQLGLRPRARIVSMAAVGSDPLLMLTGVVPATEKALAGAGLDIADIDAYEVNEAFAPVPLVWARETGADPDRLNVHGGAIALGHPLGATGTKLRGHPAPGARGAGRPLRAARHLRGRRHGQRDGRRAAAARQIAGRMPHAGSRHQPNR